MSAVIAVIVFVAGLSLILPRLLRANEKEDEDLSCALGPEPVWHRNLSAAEVLAATRSLPAGHKFVCGDCDRVFDAPEQVMFHVMVEHPHEPAEYRQEGGDL